MARTTQSILCCIGESVAGRPTQYVLERAFAAAELDWKVISVEVDAAQLEIALQGAEAMQFSALRFLSPLDSTAASILDASNEVVQFVGSATSAIWSETGWETWHADGYGIIREVEAHCDWQESMCVLVGDSPRIRSVVAASVEKQPRQIVWLNDAQSDVDLAGQISNLRGHCPTFIDIELLTGDQIAEWLELNRDIHHPLVVVGAGDDFARTWITHIRNQIRSDSAVLYLLDASLNALFASPQASDQVISIGSNSQAVSAKAYDFERWTGIAPDIAQMRDAYDEYCDF